jgi:hypothetical protein
LIVLAISYILAERGEEANEAVLPGRVFDFTTGLGGIAQAYAAMDERRAIKSLVKVGTI